ncbi:adenylate kinase 7-like isoform X2 [Paramacrobiotus metropolitanus]|nr:adenylate kinase 7-like isoform X2 [Paramacrobiotus metropolitanus]
MTWALTKKPGDNTEKDTEKTEDDEEEEGLTEETFRKRRTHPAYRYHLELEKDVLKYGSDHPGQLTTAVVAVGLVYGLGEDTLHWMLRDAWEGRDAVRLPGEGKIRTPMIHARDLCQIVQSFCENKPSRRYLVGVDSGSIKFQKIAEAVSVNLGSGFVENINPSKLLTLRLIDQVQFDILTTDLHFTPGIVKSDMKFTWTAETGILDALQKVIQEYRLVRRLTPIRILVAGPPFTGKTQLSHRLCDHYHLHYLDVHEVVETALTALRKFIDSETKRRAALTEDELENEPEEESSRLETSQELMIKIEESQEKDGKIGETFVIRFVKETLASNPSKNQGFVLDNFPDTFGHAKLLFGADRGEDDEEEEAESNHDDEFGSAPVPEFVFYLDSPEELIRKMVMERPDEPGPTAAPTSEDRYRSRLKEYHETHPGNENGVVKYCDEHSHPVHFLDRAHVDPELTFQTAVGIVGPPHNYGLSKEDRLEELRKDQEKERKRREEEEKIRKMNEREFLVKRQKNCAEWAMKLEDHHRLRGQQVQEGTANVRDYLLKNVLPQLQAGLLEAARVRPEDPVDFLGEFLLQLANPERAQPPLTTNQKLARASRF